MFIHLLLWVEIYYSLSTCRWSREEWVAVEGTKVFHCTVGSIFWHGCPISLKQPLWTLEDHFMLLWLATGPSLVSAELKKQIRRAWCCSPQRRYLVSFACAFDYSGTFWASLFWRTGVIVLCPALWVVGSGRRLSGELKDLWVPALRGGGWTVLLSPVFLSQLLATLSSIWLGLSSRNLPENHSLNLLLSWELKRALLCLKGT